MEQKQNENFTIVEQKDGVLTCRLNKSGEDFLIDEEDYDVIKGRTLFLSRGGQNAIDDPIVVHSIVDGRTQSKRLHLAIIAKYFDSDDLAVEHNNKSTHDNRKCNFTVRINGWYAKLKYMDIFGGPEINLDGLTIDDIKDIETRACMPRKQKRPRGILGIKGDYSDDGDSNLIDAACVKDTFKQVSNDIKSLEEEIIKAENQIKQLHINAIMACFDEGRIVSTEYTMNKMHRYDIRTVEKMYRMTRAFYNKFGDNKDMVLCFKWKPDSNIPSIVGAVFDIKDVHVEKNVWGYDTLKTQMPDAVCIMVRHKGPNDRYESITYDEFVERGLADKYHDEKEAN